MDEQIKGNRLIDKVAIVTGGGSGIGEATCRLFAKEGASVVVADIDEASAQRVANEIKKGGGKAAAARVDVACKDGVDKVVLDTLAQWSKIDILVQCAGVGKMEWFIDSDGSTWDEQISINLKGTILFAHAVLPHMRDRKYGKIINISSTSGKVGTGMQAIYSATKAAVDGFTKALAREVARYQINVNDICPGLIDTPMYDQVEPKLIERILHEVAFRRMGKPEEVAAAALFLASDESSFITGHSMIVDGGITFI